LIPLAVGESLIAIDGIDQGDLVWGEHLAPLEPISKEHLYSLRSPGFQI
jgi:hypothetical protein